MPLARKSVWSYWRYPNRGGEGMLVPWTMSIQCTSCGKEDGNSEDFHTLRRLDAERSQQERASDAREKQRRLDEENAKVKKSPIEWAD